MKIISHRGNLNGREPDNENCEDYISLALKHGFDVEVDVWYLKNNFWLGHDEAQTMIDVNFLNNENLWIHAKNLDALYKLTEHELKSNFFWHQSDDYTLTSKNFIWTYPEKKVVDKTVIVSNEFDMYVLSGYGICTDFPIDARIYFNSLR